MIEVTLIEVVLLVWAGLATAAALKYREDVRATRFMMRVFIEDKNVRDQMLASYAKVMGEQA